MKKAPVSDFPKLTFEEALGRLKCLDWDPARLADEIGALGSVHPEYFSHKFSGGLEMQQIPSELAQLADRVIQRFAGRSIDYLEVGVGSCGTLIFLDSLFRKHGVSARLHAVDNLNYYEAHGLKGQKGRIEWCVQNLNLDFANLDSGSKDFERWMGDRSFDLTLIDGDHSFEGCALDFAICLPRLAEKGTLVLHDVTSAICPGVGRLLEHIRPLFRNCELISNSVTCGIAVLDGRTQVSLGPAKSVWLAGQGQDLLGGGHCAISGCRCIFAVGQRNSGDPGIFRAPAGVCFDAVLEKRGFSGWFSGTRVVGIESFVKSLAQFAECLEGFASGDAIVVTGPISEASVSANSRLLTCVRPLFRSMRLHSVKGGIECAVLSDPVKLPLRDAEILRWVRDEARASRGRGPACVASTKGCVFSRAHRWLRSTVKRILGIAETGAQSHER